MNDDEVLRAQQLAFGAHLRDPGAHPPPPGVEDRRMAVYRDLFFNGLEGLLRGNFPVLVAVLGDEAWRALVRAFYAGHRCETPLFTEIGREFVAWLSPSSPRKRGPMATVDPRLRGDDGWMHELAHYEWIELALQISEATEPPHDPEGDLLAGVPVASALAWPLAYRWPVHRIAPGFDVATEPAAPTFLLACRDPDGDVRFSELTPLAFRLLQRIDEDSGATGATLLRALAEEARAPDQDVFLAEGAAMLDRFRTAGVLLGTRPRC